MQAIVTGATGYIGSKLVARLLAANYTVVCLKRVTSATEHLNWNDKVDWIDYDGTIESILLQQAKLAPAAVIFHLAADTKYDLQASDISDMLASNIELGTQLLEVARHIGITKFINTGSYWQLPLASARPNCFYTATKQAFLNILDLYADTYGVKTITLFLYDVYGVADGRKKILNILIDHVGSTELLKMSPGYQYMDLVYIDDVTSAYLQAAQQLDNECTAHAKYAVCSGQQYSLREIVAICEQMVGAQIKIKWGALSYRRKQIMQPWLPTDDYMLPGWSANCDLRSGINNLLLAGNMHACES